uniref:Putative lipoprotein YbbD n=1 Tax=Talaromyces marneffei PM1 TaxID=1077442 RepID=A0A093VQQ6_TALMA
MSSDNESGLRRKVGQLFAVGFHGFTSSPEIRTLIRDYGLGAVILFRRNIKDATQLQALTLALQQEAKDAGHEHPLFIGIDQEHGLVTRITPQTAAQQPGQMTLGATQSADNAYKIGKCTGEMLSFFGINMNYAPVCDVNSEPLNPVIGVRSFGDNPNFVAKMSSATARGLRETGVVPTVKHFPGHGDTAVDSHHGLPVINKSRSELERCELIPFRRVVAEGIEAVMTAHIALPRISSGPESNRLPATLSPEALGILRNDMKYDGVIVTDCLEMNGIRGTYGTVDGTLMSLKAGSDSVMICHTYAVQVTSIERVVQAVKSGELPESRICEALRRITSLKERFLSWEYALRSTDKLSLDELHAMNEKHQQIATKVYSQSTTVIRNSLKVLPVSGTLSKVLLLTPGGKMPAGGAVDDGGPNHKTYIDVLQHAVGNTSSSITRINYPDTGELAEEHWKMIEIDADIVILTSINAKEAEGQRNFALEVAKRRKDVIAIATCNPYDFLDDDELFKTYVATYEPTVEAFASAIDVIFGRAPAMGTLPVASTLNSKRDAHHEVLTLDESQNDSMIDGILNIWNAALPDYPLPAENLRKVINQPHGHHFIARDTQTKIIIGFCLSYTSQNEGQTSAEIAVIAVHPSKRHQGIGTELLATTREYLYENYGCKNTSLRSYFPRFWPGLPVDLTPETEQFFVHSGFRFTRGGDSDLYQDIRNFVSPHEYIDKAVAVGVKYKAIETPEEFENCLVGQKRNFSHYTGWVEAFTSLHPSKHPRSIMAGFNQSTGTQIAWTLMLSPDDDFVSQNWAFPPLASGSLALKTGIIGCVGVDQAHRSRGVGLALLCHAIEDMKQRGVEAVFVDSTDIVDWYAKVGFGRWKEYIRAEI